MHLCKGIFFPSTKDLQNNNFYSQNRRRRKIESDLVENYRPTAKTPFFSKICEKLTYSKVVAFFDKCDPFTNNPFGYKKKETNSVCCYGSNGENSAEFRKT